MREAVAVETGEKEFPPFDQPTNADKGKWTLVGPGRKAQRRGHVSAAGVEGDKGRLLIRICASKQQHAATQAKARDRMGIGIDSYKVRAQKLK